MIPLPKQQREIITEFYNLKREKVFSNKKQRDELWNKTKNRKQINFDVLKQNMMIIRNCFISEKTAIKTNS